MGKFTGNLCRLDHIHPYSTCCLLFENCLHTIMVKLNLFSKNYFLSKNGDLQWSVLLINLPVIFSLPILPKWSFANSLLLLQLSFFLPNQALYCELEHRQKLAKQEIGIIFGLKMFLWLGCVYLWHTFRYCFFSKDFDEMKYLIRILAN